jgi:hypothetical protein
MSIAVEEILEEALRLSDDSRTELVEAILERSSLSQDFLGEQLSLVRQRMLNVRNGVSELIPAEEAHDKVLLSLELR